MGAPRNQSAIGWRARPAVALASAALSTTIAVLPVFVFGALAVVIREDLPLSPSAVGLVASFWYLTSSVLSYPAGRVAERLGARRGMVFAALATAACLLGVGVLMRNWWNLFGFMLVGAFGNALAHPSANLALAGGTPPRRIGLAFGAKQAAVPLATLVGGAAVPIVGLTVGWRWGFVVAACGAALFALLVPVGTGDGEDSDAGGARTDVSAGTLAVLGLAAALGVMAGNALGLFYVDTAVSHGYSVAVGGVALAVGSIVAIGARIGWGWLSDLVPGHRMLLLTGIIALGAVGIAMLALSGGSALFIVATLVAFGAAWGWAGLLQAVVVMVSPSAPGRATGTVLTYLRLGTMCGPLLIGYMAEHHGYRTTWLLAAGLLLLSAGGMLVARVLIRRQRSGVLAASGVMLTAPSPRDILP